MFDSQTADVNRCVLHVTVGLLNAAVAFSFELRVFLESDTRGSGRGLSGLG